MKGNGRQSPSELRPCVFGFLRKFATFLLSRFFRCRSVPFDVFLAAMALASPQGLRQRRLSDSARTSDHVHQVHVVDDRDEKPRLNSQREEVVWGKTPSGEGAWPLF